ncbi:MAG: hypothetical protein ACKOBW_18265 [Planctomycetota bacterium]
MVSAEQTTDGDWYLQIPEGVVYGPIAVAQLDQWVREGRVALGCQLRRDDSNQWQPAELRYPELNVRNTTSGTPADQTTASAGSPSDHTGNRAELPQHSANDRRTQLPHRAPFILTLALVGLFVPCPVFSVLAWQQGTQDLYDMHAGLMDSTGRWQTQFARKLGMVVVLFWSMMFLAGAVVGAVYWAIR